MTPSFQSLLPPNSTRFEQAMERAMARAGQIRFDFSNLWNKDTEDDVLLSHIAWSLGVEIWSRALDITEKRRLLAEYVAIRAVRGTMAALKKALAAINVAANITERPNGRPFYFKIDIAGQNITPELKRDITMLIDLLKPLRTRYEIEIGVSFASAMTIDALVRATQIYRATVFCSHGEAR